MSAGAADDRDGVARGHGRNPGAGSARRAVDGDGGPPRALTAAVLALLAVVLAGWAVVVIGETTARALASAEPVRVAVVDERVEERLVADRRGSTRAPFRVVTVELPEGGRAELRSEGLAVGSTVTVYRSDGGALSEFPPARPGLLEWGLSAAVAAAAVVVGIGAVRSASRRRAPPRPGAPA
ncbi:MULTISPECIES: hypothetical protein [unclassified Agromyces]|uniref:hypothetical protein n=1 Tax=unclassified Agromyces TaxID=2639701 RepID=UPI003014CEAA